MVRSSPGASLTHGASWQPQACPGALSCSCMFCLHSDADKVNKVLDSLGRGEADDHSKQEGGRPTHRGSQ